MTKIFSRPTAEEPTGKTYSVTTVAEIALLPPGAYERFMEDFWLVMSSLRMTLTAAEAEGKDPVRLMNGFVLDFKDDGETVSSSKAADGEEFMRVEVRDEGDEPAATLNQIPDMELNVQGQDFDGLFQECPEFDFPALVEAINDGHIVGAVLKEKLSPPRDIFMCFSDGMHTIEIGGLQLTLESPSRLQSIPWFHRMILTGYAEKLQELNKITSAERFVTTLECNFLATNTNNFT